ncbi:MAG: DUF4097 family beta strand repeat protein [Pseudonocardiaceae bacterium]|nr:DUF4097 family beta strand repeat protein [Pseudonocardiaceae bacterium]
MTENDTTNDTTNGTTNGTAEARAEVVRQQDFTVDGAVELDLATGSGRVEVTLGDEDGVHVEIRHEPGAGAPWAEGLSSLLSWVTEQFPPVADAVGGAVPGDASEAVRQTRIDMTAGRLVVRTPKALPLRNVPLAVSVRAPRGSNVEVRTGGADITVDGTAGQLDASSGSGAVTVERADGLLSVRTGSGDVRLGEGGDRMRTRTGSGDIEASSLDGSATIISGTGDVRLGTVSAAVMARTGSGDVTVTEAVRDHLELISGSGEIRVGIRSGTHAEIDLSSGAGKVRSELDVADETPDEEAALRIRGRSGTGDVVIVSSRG